MSTPLGVSISSELHSKDASLRRLITCCILPADALSSN
jgi:hypothetical protein